MIFWVGPVLALTFILRDIYTDNLNVNGNLTSVNINDNGTYVSISSDFTYDDNAYGEIYYSGSGVTISTSGSANRLQITNATNDMLSIEDSKNLTLSGDTIFTDVTGVFDASINVSGEGSSSTCTDWDVTLELYNSSNVLQDTLNPTTQGRCSTEGTPATAEGLFTVASSGYYIIPRIKGSAAVDIDIKRVTILIRKKDKYTAP